MANEIKVWRTVLLVAGLSVTLLDARAGHESGAQIVIEWNERAYESANAADQFLTFKGHRALAMMHLA